MKLTHWAKAGKDRVYVRGFAWGEKAFVELRRRKLYPDVDGMFAPELLEAVLKARGSSTQGMTPARTHRSAPSLRQVLPAQHPAAAPLSLLGGSAATPVQLRAGRTWPSTTSR